MNNEKAFMIADRLFWIFIENTHPNKIDDYIEADPDNPEGTRNTERGRELFDEIELIQLIMQSLFPEKCGCSWIKRKYI